MDQAPKAVQYVTEDFQNPVMASIRRADPDATESTRPGLSSAGKTRV